MYNRVILMGRLTKDPELKTTQSGISMCRFSIAVDRYSKGDDKKCDFIDCTAWRQTAEFVCKYFSKGRMIHVEGDIQNNNYTDNNGIKHYQNTINVQNVSFCGDKSSEGQQSQNYGAPQYANQQYAQPVQPPQAQYYQQPMQQPVQQYQQMPVQQPVQQPVQLGSLADFTEIPSDTLPF